MSLIKSTLTGHRATPPKLQATVVAASAAAPVPPVPGPAPDKTADTTPKAEDKHEDDDEPHDIIIEGGGDEPGDLMPRPAAQRKKQSHVKMGSASTSALQKGLVAMSLATKKESQSHGSLPFENNFIYEKDRKAALRVMKSVIANNAVGVLGKCISIGHEDAVMLADGGGKDLHDATKLGLAVLAALGLPLDSAKGFIIESVNRRLINATLTPANQVEVKEGIKRIRGEIERHGSIIKMSGKIDFFEVIRVVMRHAVYIPGVMSPIDYLGCCSSLGILSKMHAPRMANTRVVFLSTKERKNILDWMITMNISGSKVNHDLAVVDKWAEIKSSSMQLSTKPTFAMGVDVEAIMGAFTATDDAMELGGRKDEVPAAGRI